jgi:hypothetical protein
VDELDSNFASNFNLRRYSEGVTDSKQGRFSTFTALTKHGAYGYAGTSGRDENCADCQHRSACIFMFSLDFAEGDSPTKAGPD